MTAHTPGPWSIERGQVRNAHGEALASVPYTLGGPEDAANGRLIAAAPELYAVLRWILRNAGYESGEAEPTLHDLQVARVHLDRARALLQRIDGEVTP